VQRRHNCSPEASFANCVITLYLLKLKIYGPVQEGDIWRIRYNEELNRLIEGKDIVKFIKAQRIRWLGHVKRMEAGAIPRMTMEGRLFIGRRKGRPRLRWMDG
jgi:hypothetical protein